MDEQRDCVSPAAATLLAQAGGTYKSPNGNATTIQPDWLGMGLAGNVIMRSATTSSSIAMRTAWQR